MSQRRASASQRSYLDVGSITLHSRFPALPQVRS